MMAAKDLTEAVQDLPPELFNEIYQLVFFTNDERIDVGPEYKRPSHLQVSKDTREKFSKPYFTNTTFIFRHRLWLSKWLRSLKRKELRWLKSLRLITRQFRDSENQVIEEEPKMTKLDFKRASSTWCHVGGQANGPKVQAKTGEI